MKQGLEIERKFLLKRMPIGKEERRLVIRQRYCVDGEQRFRVRETYENHKHTYDKTVKLALRPGVYDETVIDIDSKEFDKLTKLAHRCIFKVRSHFPHTSDGLVWEVDDLIDCKLVIAEIEMPTENYDLIIPDFIKDVLIMEVTHLKEFTNYSLAEII